MLSNEITLSDGTDSHTYDLVSRVGMNSIRRHTTDDSAKGRALIIKNTVDISPTSTAQNRHLIQLMRSEINPTTSEKYALSVHVVIARDKDVDDALLKKEIAQLVAFLSVDANITDILLGGN